MAYEVVLINGVTKQELGGRFEYHFPAMKITANNASGNLTFSEVGTGRNQPEIVAFANITDKLGASTPEEYCDALASAGYFFDQASGGGGSTAWGAITGTLSNQTDLYPRLKENQVIVRQASDLSGVLDSTIEYFIDGIIDMGTQSIEVPISGLSIRGYDFNVSGLVSSENGYTLFTSPIGGAGDLIMDDVFISVTGTGSQVFGLVNTAAFNAIEINKVNYIACSSRGELNGYRQMLESGCGMFGGTPELTFSGTWLGGYRIDTSIATNMSNLTSFYKAGAGFSFGGRFILSMNCNLPSTGAFVDFDPSNITNDESLQIDGSRITRDGVLNSSDTTIYPNIDETNVKSLWTDNAGIPNTVKSGTLAVTTEVQTVIDTQGVFVPIAGTYTVSNNSHFDQPSNGELRLLSGNGKYKVFGNLIIDGNANIDFTLRVTKSSDNGATFPVVIYEIGNIIDSLQGGRDVARVNFSTIATISADERIRLEIRNDDNASNFTMENGSSLITFQ